MGLSLLCLRPWIPHFHHPFVLLSIGADAINFEVPLVIDLHLPNP
jgi:hypothetical protein